MTTLDSDIMIERHRTFVHPQYHGKGKWYAASGEATCPYCKVVIHFRESDVPYRAMTGQYDVLGDKCPHFVGLSQRPRGHSSMVVAFHRLGKRIYKGG